MRASARFKRADLAHYDKVGMTKSLPFVMLVGHRVVTVLSLE
jgi:hypothetical protein